MKTLKITFEYLREVSNAQNQRFLKYICLKISLNIAKSWLGIIMISVLIDALTRNEIVKSLVIICGGLLAMLFIEIGYSRLVMKLNIVSNKIDMWLNLRTYSIMMNSEYDEQDNQYKREKYEFAKIAINEIGFYKVINNFEQIDVAMINIVIAITALSFINIYIIIVILIATVLNIASEAYKIKCQYMVNKDIVNTFFQNYIVPLNTLQD